MPLNRLKPKNYTNITLPILVFLLLCGLFVFVKNSLRIVSETSRSNFAYVIKLRETSEEIDRIVERAGININVASDIIQETYDITRLHNEAYNAEHLREIDVVIKAMLMNSPGVNGSWFQLNVDLPFSGKHYAWYTIDNGKITNFKALLDKKSPEPRILDPNTDLYYFEAVKNKKLTWSDVYTDPDSNIKMLTISEPIYKNNQLIGVVGIDISTQNLQDALKNMQAVLEGSKIFLLDKNDKVILAQLVDHEKISPIELNMKKLFENNIINDQGMAQYTENGKLKTALKFGLSNKYKVVITFENKKLFSGFDRLFNSIYFIFAIMVILAIRALINRVQITKINK